MQLKVNPLVNAHCHNLLHIAGARTESESIQRVQSASLSSVVGTRCLLVLVFVFFSREHLRNRTRQAEADEKDDELRAAQTHEDSKGKRRTLLIINPKGRKRLLPVITKDSRF